MCGIYGTLGPRAIEAREVWSGLDAIAHRGPDDEGALFVDRSLDRVQVHGGAATPAAIYASGLPYAPVREEISGATHLALGHRRLSVLDLSPAGHQPMCRTDRRVWLVFNGEIYNYLELREELTTLGHAFRSDTDTEVILAGWRQWGEACVHRFNGMFAFLLVDLDSRTLFAARDRFGIKPLYYRVGPDGTIAFASEIKQFAVAQAAGINPTRCYDFLVWGLTDHTAETLFDRVYQLRPGQAVTIDLDAAFDGRYRTSPLLPVNTWYQLEPRPFSGSLADAGRVFHDAFEDSVRLHLRADVPIGTCLSGGLDSSSIVMLIHGLLGGRGRSAQKTFSAGSEHAQFDERQWIDHVIEATGVEAHFVYPSPDGLFHALPDLTWHQDEPFGSTSVYAQWHVFQLAAANEVKVVLDGQGADEQLAGYHPYFSALLASQIAGLKWTSAIRELCALKRVHGYSPLAMLGSTAMRLVPSRVADLARKFSGRRHRAPAWLNLDALGVEKTDVAADAGASARSVHELSRAQLTSTNLQMLLHWEDRNSMAHSIEARVPFLDHRLVETVLGMPDEFKISDGITKRLMRCGLRDVLPEPIRRRTDKMGFVTPEEHWIRHHDPRKFKTKLGEAIAASGGILKPSAAVLADDIIAGRQPFSFDLWRLISFGAWRERFNVG